MLGRFSKLRDNSIKKMARKTFRGVSLGVELDCVASLLGVFLNGKMGSAFALAMMDQMVSDLECRERKVSSTGKMKGLDQVKRTMQSNCKASCNQKGKENLS